MSAFQLNCLLLNDDPKKQVFTVEITSETVSILKDMIKAKKAPQLDHLVASDFILWKVIRGRRNCASENTRLGFVDP